MSRGIVSKIAKISVGEVAFADRTPCCKIDLQQGVATIGNCLL